MFNASNFCPSVKTIETMASRAQDLLPCMPPQQQFYNFDENRDMCIKALAVIIFTGVAIVTIGLLYYDWTKTVAKIPVEGDKINLIGKNSLTKSSSTGSS